MLLRIQFLDVLLNLLDILRDIVDVHFDSTDLLGYIRLDVFLEVLDCARKNSEGLIHIFLCLLGELVDLFVLVDDQVLEVCEPIDHLRDVVLGDLSHGQAAEREGRGP